MMPQHVSPERLQVANPDAPVRRDGDFVLYWMTSARRMGWNFALDHTVAWCRALGKPLVVFEGLRCGHQWASDRIHAFVTRGMRDNAAAVRAAGGAVADGTRVDAVGGGCLVIYLPWIERRDGDGKGLLAALSDRACVVVGDDFPCFFLPRMAEAAGRTLAVRLELVDGNGLLPMRATDRVFGRAHDFRRYVQKTLPGCLAERPAVNPLKSMPKISLDTGVLKGIASRVLGQWPAMGAGELGSGPDLSRLPIDHSICPSPVEGGSAAARKCLKTFLAGRIGAYADGRNQPDDPAASGMSPWLHFGHISAHEIAHAIFAQEEWSPEKVAPKATGEREGWWGMSPGAEAYLDQLVTWRELGFNMCAHRPDYGRYDSLPEWAKATIERHAGDARPYVYSREQFARAGTHDRVWNAAQRELVHTGVMHNYLRMLWGKKIIEWSPDARSALETMIDLNNRYALDGRNPNSYSGIFWCLGRYDRPWGPERPVMGTLRYMTSDSTVKKLRMKAYLARWGGGPGPGLFGG